MLLTGIVVFLVIGTPSAVRRWRRARAGRCVRCGYDLRGGADRVGRSTTGARSHLMRRMKAVLATPILGAILSVPIAAGLVIGTSWWAAYRVDFRTTPVSRMAMGPVTTGGGTMYEAISLKDQAAATRIMWMSGRRRFYEIDGVPARSVEETRPYWYTAPIVSPGPAYTAETRLGPPIEIHVSDGYGWPMRSMRASYVVTLLQPPPTEVQGLPLNAGTTFRDQVWTFRLLPTRPIWPGFGVNMLLAVAVVLLATYGPLAFRRRRRARAGRCVRCGYDLRGAGADVSSCPECGPIRSSPTA